MATANGDVIEYLQKQFEEEYGRASAAAQRLSREAKQRRWAAYTLKAIAIFGGISIAAGLRGVWSQVVGLLVTVAVAVDALFSNHKRLLTVTAAANAYSNLLRNIRQTYNQKLVGILKLKGPDGKKAKAQLENLIDGLLRELHNEQNQIEGGLQAADLKLLDNISLEQHAAASAAGSRK